MNVLACDVIIITIPCHSFSQSVLHKTHSSVSSSPPGWIDVQSATQHNQRACNVWGYSEDSRGVNLVERIRDGGEDEKSTGRTRDQART